MSRVIVLAHYTPYTAPKMSAFCSDESLHEEIQEEIYEIEVFKSQIVTVVSCGVTEDRGEVENIRYKSCGGPTVRFDSQVISISEGSRQGAQNEGVSLVNSCSDNKPRRFKRISLPQWLLKPSRKVSQNSTRFRRHGKRKILRTYSAPKALGNRGHDSRFSVDELATTQRFCVSATPTETPEVQGSAPDFNPVKDPKKARRISLPVGVTSDMEAKDRKFSVPRKLRTSDHPKNTSNESQANFIRSLQSKDDVATSRPAENQAAAEIDNTEGSREDQSSVNNHEKLSTSTRENHSQLKNAKRDTSASALKPLPLKLHKFHNPDIFYVPLPDDDLQSPVDSLSKKLCRARLVEPENENYIIKERVQQELESFLGDKTFCSRSCQQWCLELSNIIKMKAQCVKGRESKIVCVVYIGALRGHGVHAAVQCLWTPNDDNFVTVHYQNRSLLAIACLLAVAGA